MWRQSLAVWRSRVSAISWPKVQGLHVIDANQTAKRIIANVEKVIVGKRQQLILALVAWFSEGHILLEDVPGVAKTMLARALARSVGCSFKRIQCTPDLLPTDVTGGVDFQPEDGRVRVPAGPGLCPVAVGRRNQPHDAAHAGRPAWRPWPRGASRSMASPMCWRRRSW